jgi:hypothetical protein
MGHRLFYPVFLDEVRPKKPLTDTHSGTALLMIESARFNLTRSIMSGRFVAAMIVTSFKGSTPSISTRSWARTRSWTFEDPLDDPLSPPRESISSKKITQGATCRAFRKTSLTAFSDSPTHLLNSSDPFTKEIIIN